MDKAQRLYLWLTAVFVTCLLVADTTGGKLFTFELAGIQVRHSVGQLSFPITFLLTDVLNEFYGAKGARRATFVGFGMVVLAFGLYAAGNALPVAADSFVPQAAFARVFGLSQQLIVASLSAYLVGQLLDIALFARLKRWSHGRHVWLRATGSTAVSQAVDTLIVTMILTAGQRRPGGELWTLAEKLDLALTGYWLKLAIAVALTPCIYLLRWTIRTKLGVQPLPA